MVQLSRALSKYQGTSLKSFRALPAPELRQFIGMYFGQEFDVQGYPGKYMPRLLLLPTSSVLLSFCYHDTIYLVGHGCKQFHFSNLLTGVHSIESPYYVDEVPRRNCQVFTVFKPGALYRFFGICDCELKNDCLKVDEALGNTTRLLEEQMNDPISVEERIDILNRFFVRRLYGKRSRMSNDDLLNAVKLIQVTQGKMRIEEISRELSVTRRTLERQFIERIGLTPKEFSKIVRFENLFKVIASEDAVDWQDLVDTLGFYDQSHLIRDFKLATTLTPEFFVREKGKTIVPFREASIILSGPLVEQPDSYQRAMIEAEESEPRNLHRPQGCCRDPFY